VQSSGTVLENELENGAGSLAVGFHTHGHNTASRRGGHPKLQIPDAKEVSSIFVTPWSVEKQVSHGMEIQTGQLQGTFLPDPRERFQGGGEWIRGCSLHTNLLLLLQAFVSTSVAKALRLFS